MGQNTLEDKNRKIQSGGDSVPLVLTNISLQPGTIMHKQLPFAQIGVAAIPLLVSFPIALWGETEPITLAMLIAIMFLCSVCLLILTMKEGLKVYCIARPILVGGFVFWYSYPGFIEVILGKPWNDGLPIAVSPQVVAWTVVYLSIFLFTSMLTATLFFSPRLTNKGNVSVWRINDGSVVALAVIAVLVGFIPYFLGGNGLDNLLVSITSARGIVKPWVQNSTLGNADSAFSYLMLSCLIGGTVLLWTTTFLTTRIKLILRSLFGILALLATTVVYLDQGTRSLFVLIALPPLILGFLRLWKRAKGLTILLASITCILGFVAVQFQLYYRSTYTRDHINELILTDVATLGDTSDFFKETLFSVALVPQYHDYFYESALLQFVVAPIPRFLWPEKPVPTIVWYYTYIRWGIDNLQQPGNMLPGIVGQHYMSWGWFGPVVVGIIFGWLTSQIDSVLTRLRTDDSIYLWVACLMFACWMFITFRNLSPGFFYPVVACALIVLMSRTKISKRI